MSSRTHPPTFWLRPRHLALALAATCAGPAFAQSSVTVFGVADVGVRSVNNSGVGSVTSEQSGGNQTSRLGFRGTEDLGNGLRAGFWLETGILVDTGTSTTPTQFFDRRATVSLSSKDLGEIRLGRDYVPTYTLGSRADPFGYIGAAGAGNFISAAQKGPIAAAFGSNPNTLIRANNTLQYFLPSDFGGVEGELMVAPGEGGAAASGLAKVVAGRLGYHLGPFEVHVAALSAQNNLTTSGKFSDTEGMAIYDAGVVKLSAAVRQLKYATAKQTNYLLGAVIPAGPGNVNLSWNRANLSGSVGSANISSNDASQLALGYVYNLSKHTGLYGNLVRIENDGAATFMVSGGAKGMSGGGSSTGYEVGIRHAF